MALLTILLYNTDDAISAIDSVAITYMVDIKDEVQVQFCAATDITLFNS